MKQQGSLSVVGCGIKFSSHWTTEAQALIKNADRVLYLVNEPLMQEWLKTHIKNAENLESAYAPDTLRRDTYRAITEAILQALTSAQHVCVVLEGHPLVFAKPALDAVIEAKKRGIATFVAPGISAEDYLFADLLIDPGSVGCQSYEATDFLIHDRAFDGCSHLILWQISVVGMLDSNITNMRYAQHAQLLVDKLSSCYPLTHQVILYEGSQYPHIASHMIRIALADLPSTSVNRLATLYLPPAKQATLNLDIIKAMQLDLYDLRKTP